MGPHFDTKPTGAVTARVPQGGAALARPLQAGLRINQPGDTFEQEAERAAEQVMRSEPGLGYDFSKIRVHPVPSGVLQRAAPVQPAPPNQPQPSFVGCTQQQQDILLADLEKAKNLAIGALDAISQTGLRPLYRQAFTAHFGADADGQKDVIIARYTNIRDSLSKKEITCAGSCAKRQGVDTLCANGYENSNRMRICPDYWTAGFCQTYSTLLHEAVHNDGGLMDVKKTDPGYPPANAKDNAYSYEYFAVDFEEKIQEAAPDSGKKPEGELPLPTP